MKITMKLVDILGTEINIGDFVAIAMYEDKIDINKVSSIYEQEKGYYLEFSTCTWRQYSPNTTMSVVVLTQEQTTQYLLNNK